MDDDAKQLPFGEAETGATGVELLLPLALKWAEESKLPLLKGLSRITADPARILGVAVRIVDVDAGRLHVRQHGGAVAPSAQPQAVRSWW